MNMRSKSLAAVTAAALAVTGLSVPSFAASPVSKPATALPGDTAAVPTTDFSSRRRHYRYNNNAAAVGAFLAIAGTAAAVAALATVSPSAPLRLWPASVLWRLRVRSAAGLRLLRWSALPIRLVGVKITAERAWLRPRPLSLTH